MTHRNPNAREAEDLLEASMAAHMHLDELHKSPTDNRGRIAATNQRLGISLKMADARATLAVAEEQRRTAKHLEAISTALGRIADRITAALSTEVFECGECDADNLLEPGLCDECAERHVRAAEEARA